MQDLMQLFPDATPELPDPAIAVSYLKEAMESLHVKHEFKRGDLVQTKPGHGIHKDMGPGIIAEILDEPVISSNEDTSSHYYGEPNDLIVGYWLPLGNDGKCAMALFHMDSRRLEPYTGPTE